MRKRKKVTIYVVNIGTATSNSNWQTTKNHLSRTGVIEMAMIKKISIAKLGAKPSKVEPTELIRVWGIATGTVTGESQFGEWVALVGSFKAVNLSDGEVFTSSKCFLPSVASDYLVQYLKNGESSIEFALQIDSVPSETAIGYEYVVKPLLEVDEPKALTELEARAGIQLS